MLTARLVDFKDEFNVDNDNDNDNDRLNVDNDRSSSGDCLEELVEHQHQLLVCHRTLDNCVSLSLIDSEF